MKRRIKSYIIFIVYLTECTSSTTEGLFLVLTALADQTVKPLAQIVGYYLCSDSLNECDESIHGCHLLSALGGHGEGPQRQYSTKSDSVQF